nr:hypothetical protein [Enterovibrio nigricans]
MSECNRFTYKAPFLTGYVLSVMVERHFMDASLLAFIPLILTIVLALVLRHTLVALGAGIIAGALVLSHFQPIASLSYLADIATSQFYKQGEWQGWHLDVIATMVLLGVMTQLLARVVLLWHLVIGFIAMFALSVMHGW